MKVFQRFVGVFVLVALSTGVASAQSQDPPQSPPAGTQGQDPPPGQKPPPPPPPAEPPPYEEKVVVTASKTEQLLVNAPATMTVIGGKALELAPSNNYADLLRAVPGVNITQISARDINVTSRAATSSLATSQLAVLDGRTLYQDFFGFVMWDFMPSNPNEIKQIEVIRGPASAVWGANALNGVINVITKTPREMQGTSFVMGAGSFGKKYGSDSARNGSMVYGNITHAEALNDRWAFKVSMGAYQSDAFARPTGVIPGSPTRTAYPTYTNTGTSQPKIDVRFDYDGMSGERWEFSGGVAGTDGIMHTGIGPFDINRGTRFTYGKANYSKGAFRVQAFINALQGDAVNLVAVDTSGVPVTLDFDTKTIDLEASNTNIVGMKHVLTYGGNLRYNRFDLSLARTENQRKEGGLYIQDDMFLTEHARLVVGARVDKFTSIDNPVFSPRVSLMLKPNADSTIRLSYNRAFRAPSAINNNLDTIVTNAVPLGLFNPAFGSTVFRVPTTAVGNKDLTEERMDAFEVGYSGTFNNRVTVSAAYYYTKLKDEIFFTQTGEYGPFSPPAGWPAVLNLAWAALYTGQATGTPVRFPTSFTYLNLGRVNNHGLELGVDAALNPATSAYVNYSWQAEPDPNFALSELNLPPTNRFNVGLNYQGRRLFGSASLSYVDKAFWQDILDARYSGTTDAYTTINASIGATWSGGRYTTTLKVVNLTDEQVLQHIFADVMRRQVVGELRVNLPR